jgi:hypothetical protein
MQEDDLPYPLDLSARGSRATLRTMTSAERLELGFRLSDEHRRRWMQSLREKHPTATDAEFRQIVVETLLAESEEERRICEQRRRWGEERTDATIDGGSA